MQRGSGGRPPAPLGLDQGARVLEVSRGRGSMGPNFAAIVPPVNRAKIQTGDNKTRFQAKWRTKKKHHPFLVLNILGRLV